MANVYNNQEDDDRAGGSGQQGKVAFRYKDAMSIDPRDDLLPDEKRRLLAVHAESNLSNVKKQKLTREERRAIKENRQQHSQQMGLGHQGGGYAYKTHPTLANKAQFSGDRQVSMNPNQYDANTNPENRDKLENRLENRNELRHRLTHQQTPRFRPPGT